MFLYILFLIAIIDDYAFFYSDMQNKATPNHITVFWMHLTELMKSVMMNYSPVYRYSVAVQL